MGFGVQKLHKKSKTSMSIIVKRRPAALSPTPAFGTPTSATSLSSATPLETSLSITPHRRHRLRGDIIKDLALVIAEIRIAGLHANDEIAKRLNEMGLRAPSGRPFSRETTRRIQKEIKRRGLGDGPRTVSQAMSARAEKKNVRHYAELAELAARRKREHPDWD